MADWFKRSWAQLLVLFGVAAGALAVFFTGKREVPTVIPPPSTDKDVDAAASAKTGSLVNGVGSHHDET